MKFQHFFKVHQLSSNLQNILESSSETCMWNLSLFREVNLFHRKIPTVPALQISWNFNIYFKIHLISSNLQNILESSSQTCMWNSSPFREVKFFTQKTGKLNFFHRKMLTLSALQNMKFQHFFKCHQISSNLQDIMESSSETCMWNLSLFREFKAYSDGTRNIMKFHHFFQN